MDTVRARSYESELKNHKIDGWLIEEYIGAGKSAVVFKASKDESLAALKIFDRELVDLFGISKQEERISREKTLIDKYHPNLIKILDGGYCKLNNIFYIVMEYLPGITLSDAILIMPSDNIKVIISQIASAAKYLEDLSPNMAHRDIKPDNIRLNEDMDKAVLLDLGVIRPIGKGSLTDSEKTKPFLGTLRYSPPEFLLRKEKDTIDGWRAVTFYQLGAVLHDMIMKKPIFDGEVEPYARLVNAVQHTKPEIYSNSISSWLVTLAKNCLIKDADTRSNIVEWKDFNQEAWDINDISDLKRHIIKKQMSLKSSRANIEKERENENIKFVFLNKLNMFSDIVKEILRNECADSSIFPPVTTKTITNKDTRGIYIVIVLNKSETRGIKGELMICVSVSLLKEDSDVVQIKYSSAISSEAISIDDVLIINYNFTEIYNGVFENDYVKLKLQELLFGLYDRAIELFMNPEFILPSFGQSVPIEL